MGFADMAEDGAVNAKAREDRLRIKFGVYVGRCSFHWDALDDRLQVGKYTIQW